MVDNQNLNEEITRLRSQVAALEQLLDVHETTVLDQSDRLEQAMQAQAERVSELQTVAQVSTAASTILDPQELLQTVVDLGKSSFDLYHAHIYLLDKSGENLVLTAGAGEVGQQMVAQGWQVPMDAEQSLVAQAVRDRPPRGPHRCPVPRGIPRAQGARVHRRWRVHLLSPTPRRFYGGPERRWPDHGLSALEQRVRRPVR